MKKKEILFVTSQSEQFEEGLSYAIYLAETMGLNLNVLIMGNRSDLAGGLSAAVSADTVNQKDRQDLVPAFLHTRIKDLCDRSGVKSSIHTRLSAKPSVIKDFLGKLSLEIVLLSPSLSGDNEILKSLLRESSRPVVTLAQDKRMTAAYAK